MVTDINRYQIANAAICLTIVRRLKKGDAMSIFTMEKPNLMLGIQDVVDAMEASGLPPIYTLSPEEARNFLKETQSGNGIAKPEVDIKDYHLPVGPTGGLEVRVVRPKGAEGALPGVLYLHGGGWVMGGRDTHDRLIREIAVMGGVAVVFPEYGLSPENRYPVALEQCYAVFEHMARNSAEMGLQPGGFVVMGDSAGGNMATVAALLSRERGGPKILLEVLFYPVVDAEMATQSYKDFSEGPYLTRKAMKWFWDNYVPESNRRDERNVSPLRARDSDLERLPPTLIITAENDVLRDEAEEYARRLDEVGVPVASLRVNGTMHDFVMLDLLALMPSTRAAMTLATAYVKAAFRGIPAQFKNE